MGDIMAYVPVQYDSTTRTFKVQDIDADDITFAPGITKYLVSRDNTGVYICDGVSDQIEINQAISDLP